MADLPTEPCPRCGKPAKRELTEVAVFVKCPACGFEAADAVALDFKHD